MYTCCSWPGAWGPNYLAATHESMQQDMLWCWNWHELKGYVHILQELLQ